MNFHVGVIVIMPMTLVLALVLYVMPIMGNLLLFLLGVFFAISLILEFNKKAKNNSIIENNIPEWKIYTSFCEKLGINVDKIYEDFLKAYEDEISLNFVQEYLQKSQTEREELSKLIKRIEEDTRKDKETIENEIKEVKNVFNKNHSKFIEDYKADFQRQKEDKYSHVRKEAENILSK